MKVKFDKDTMPDDLYNALLLHFVQEAVKMGYNVTRSTKFNDWIVECEVD